MALAVSSVKYRSDLSIIKYYGYGLIRSSDAHGTGEFD